MNEPDINKKSRIQEITESSLKDLMTFHQIEREEKFKTLQFYGLFLGGGLALIAGTEKLQIDLFQKATIQTVAIFVIVMVLLMAIRKLIAVRIASNNIYVEYTNRLQYLLKTEVEKNLEVKHSEIESSFDRYFNTPDNKLEVLRKGSADALEIQSIKWISVLFVFLTIIPLKVILLDSNFLVNNSCFKPETSIFICFVIITILVLSYLYFINRLMKKWCGDPVQKSLANNNSPAISEPN